MPDRDDAGQRPKPYNPVANLIPSFDKVDPLFTRARSLADHVREVEEHRQQMMDGLDADFEEAAAAAKARRAEDLELQRQVIDLQGRMVAELAEASIQAKHMRNMQIAVIVIATLTLVVGVIAIL